MKRPRRGLGSIAPRGGRGQLKARMFRLAVAFVSLLAAAAGLAACGSASSTTANSGATSTNAASVALKPVSVALEYTPGADNVAFYLAQQQGYFRKAGLDVTVIPWSTSTTADELVAAGKATFGVSSALDDAIIDCAKGLPVTAVYTIVEKDPTVFGVLAKSGITSPKQLDGTKYGGFGTPEEPILLKSMIRAAGGSGHFTYVLLGTSSYQALGAGQVQSSEMYRYSDVPQAQLEGMHLRLFSPEQYGLPQAYGPMVLTSNSLLHSQPGVVRDFLRAMQQGYAYEAAHQTAAAKVVTNLTKGTATPAFARLSIAYFLPLMNPGGGQPLGTQSLTEWTQRGEFFEKTGLLHSSSGAVVHGPVAWQKCFSNAYLPGKTS